MKYNCKCNIGGFKAASLFTPANMEAARLGGNNPAVAMVQVKRCTSAPFLYSPVSPAGSAGPGWDSWGVGSSW